MTVTRFVAAASLLALATPAPAQGLGGGNGTTTWDDKVNAGGGFRWDFDTHYQIGRFANDDWWVVAPNGLTLTAITPATSMQFVGGEEWWRNGTHVDPVAASHVQGLDSSMYAQHAGFNIGDGYNHSKNIAAQTFPITVHPGPDGIASICTARSAETASNRPQILDLKILTVLDAPPPNGAFRPTYTVAESGVHQEGWLRKVHLDYGRVNVVDASGNFLDADEIYDPAPPTIADCLDEVKQAWYEAPGQAGYMKRYSRPANACPDYGYDAGNLFQVMAMRTLLDDLSVNAKKPLINKLVQIGFDRYNMAWQDQVGGTPSLSNHSGHWDEDGGHGCAAKFSILYYAWLADFPHQTASILAANDDEGPATTQWFTEETQCFRVSAATLGYTVCGYGTSTVPIGTPEWGIGHFTDLWGGANPTQDDPHWTEWAAQPAGCPVLCSYAPCGSGTPNVKYRRCCTAGGWALQVLMSRIIADNLTTVPSTWANGYPFPRVVYDYLDRFHQMQPLYGYPPSHNLHFNRQWFGGSQMFRQAWEAWGDSTVYFGRP